MNAMLIKNKKQNDNVAQILSALCADIIGNMSPACNILLHKRHYFLTGNRGKSKDLKKIINTSPCCHEYVLANDSNDSNCAFSMNFNQRILFVRSISNCARYHSDLRRWL